MSNKYLVVDKEILPTYYDKVVEAKRLIADGKARNASDAIKQVGISRNTYYKYKDSVMEMGAAHQGKRAIISMMLDHTPGILSTVIAIIARFQFSIWTINQNPPMNNQANVIICIDLTDGIGSLDDMIKLMREEDGINKVRLIGVE